MLKLIPIIISPSSFNEVVTLTDYIDRNFAYFVCGVSRKTGKLYLLRI